MDIYIGGPPLNPLHKLTIPTKPLKNRSLEGFKEAIIKHQHLASGLMKRKWGKNLVVTFIQIISGTLKVASW